MALTEWHVIFDVQNAGAGFNGVELGKKFKKGETLSTEEVGSTGLVGQVFNAKFVKVKAEGEEEACKVAIEAYAPNRSTGVAAVPHAEKELKFFNV